MFKIFLAGVITVVILTGCQTKNINNNSIKVAQNNMPISMDKNNDFNQDINQAKNMEDIKIDDINNSSNETVEYSQAVIKTSMGDIIVEFYTEDSPNTVANFIKLAGNNFYDGIKFHRVIKDFMIQAGDPQSKDDSLKSLWGTGGPGYTFVDEINDYKLVQGSLAMANAGPNTNGSQFFIVTAASTPWLDGYHTNFGQVVTGMDVVLAINEVITESQDRPVDPVVINSIELIK